jgi:DNA-binding CsgD family transcriptional regulator
MGHSLKLTAYTLGVTPSSVFRTRGTAMRKLGLRTQDEVIKLFAGATPGGGDTAAES